MGSEILLYMNMFSDFLKYWNFVVIVFENTGIMTRFLCMEEVWVVNNSQQVWSFTWFCFFFQKLVRKWGAAFLYFELLSSKNLSVYPAF